MIIRRGIDDLNKPFVKVRKKPVEVEAWQTDETIYIETLEGTLEARPGDWIIRGIRGELYPCKPDVFEKAYEIVEEV